MKIHSRLMLFLFVSCGVILIGAMTGGSQTASMYDVYVTNETSGDLTVINGATHKVVATIPLGKRPRGIKVSPDGKTLYIAVSGSPISGPPKLDAKGSPIGKKDDDDDKAKKADKSADGI